MGWGQRASSDFGHRDPAGANSHRATEKGPVVALKVRGQLASAMAYLGWYVPAKCSAIIWTISPPFCSTASHAKGQFVVWPAHSPEATAHSSVPFVAAAPVPLCLLGSQWGLGPGSQGFADIGWRQEVVVGGDLSGHLSQGLLYIFDSAQSSILCHLK